MAFYNMGQYSDGVQVNFSSPVQADRETFVSDFLVSFTYDDMYCCYCIVNNPQSDNRAINVISVHGHFLYQGNDFSSAIGRVAEYYKNIEKLNNSESDNDLTEEVEKQVTLEVRKKLKEAGVDIEKTEEDDVEKGYVIDITKN